MRKPLVLSVVVLSAAVVAAAFVEGIYRFQVVDTYGAELRAFNPDDAPADRARPTLLAMGDSFTAGRTSWAGILRDRLRRWRVVNAGIGGTGVLQALYVARNRFARFPPTAFVYQVYVG